MEASDGTILRGTTAILSYLSARGLVISERAFRGWVQSGEFPAHKSRLLGITTTCDRVDQWLAEQAGTGTK